MHRGLVILVLLKLGRLRFIARYQEPSWLGAPNSEPRLQRREH